jgi:transposase
MSRQIKADYSQIFLLPPSIEDWVGKDHPARFIREFVELLDIKDLGFKVEDNEEGRPYYSSDILLKVWLYGYFNRIRSARQLEKLTKENHPMIWLVTMHQPDHNTLWRFWRDNKRAIKKLFRETVKTAIKLKLVSFVLAAVDGTRMKALSSNKWLMEAKEIEKTLKKVDKSIDELEQEIERSEREETDYDDKLPKELEDRETLREKIRKAQEEIKESERKKININEPEARLMRAGGKIDTGYNSQIVVDSKHRIIIAEKVIIEENDLHSLTPMIEKSEEITGRAPDKIVADAGYGSGEQLSESEKRGYDVLTNLRETGDNNPYDSSKFEYSVETDVMFCPEGKELIYAGSSLYKETKLYERKYRCTDYKQCSVRWLCSKSKAGRRVKLTPYVDEIKRQRQKHETKGNGDLLQKRKTIVEPVFGWIKEIDNFRRFTVKGFESASLQWSLVCMTVNLRTIFKHWTTGTLKNTKERIKTVSINFFNNLFANLFAHKLA